MFIFNHKILNNPFSKSLPQQINGGIHGDGLSKIKESKIKLIRGNFYLLDALYGDNYAHATYQGVASLLYAQHFKIISENNDKMHFITSTKTRYFTDLLKLCKINNIITLEDNQLYCLKNCIVTNMYYYQILNYDLIKCFEYFVNDVIKHKSSEKTLNIYITRVKGQMREAENEAECIKMFQKLNYHIIATERMRIYDQINLFSKAKTIVAHHGASGANLMYTTDNFFFVEIFPETWKQPFSANILPYKNCSYAGLINPATTRFLGGSSKFVVDLDLLEFALHNPLCSFINKFSQKSPHYLQEFIDNNIESNDQLIEKLLTVCNDVTRYEYEACRVKVAVSLIILRVFAVLKLYYFPATIPTDPYLRHFRIRLLGLLPLL
ncbi:MAG: glycosyltransferase family 61 protein, partial [Desulfovibrionaceae bacterium]|nr:glycosyltransferase family 61 protein [Desulfovibrionaceae bacterium]